MGSVGVESTIRRAIDLVTGGHLTPPQGDK
jgi:hypothetical protein